MQGRNEDRVAMEDLYVTKTSMFDVMKLLISYFEDRVTGLVGVMAHEELGETMQSKTKEIILE